MPPRYHVITYANSAELWRNDETRAFARFANEADAARCEKALKLLDEVEAAKANEPEKQ